MGMSGTIAPSLIERVALRVVRDDFAFASIRLPDVHLHGIEARRGPGGIVTLRAPTRTVEGRAWPIYALQPGAVEAAAEAVRQVWDRMERAR